MDKETFAKQFMASISSMNKAHDDVLILVPAPIMVS